MSVSAFGVEDCRLEKNIFTEAIEGGMHALHGFKGGISGEVGVAHNAANARGKLAGAGVRRAATSAGGKLKPIGVAMTKTPARAATTAGVGGLGVGVAARRNN